MAVVVPPLWGRHGGNAESQGTCSPALVLSPAGGLLQEVGSLLAGLVQLSCPHPCLTGH